MKKENVLEDGTHFLKKYKLTVYGLVLGTITGLLYWKNVGCISRYQDITSKPLSSILYSSAYFIILFNLFKRPKKINKESCNKCK